MATQWISKQTTRRQAAPLTWCPLLQRSVPCTALEIWQIRADGRLGERVTAPSGDPVMVPVGHRGEMANYLYGRRGRFALVARDHRGRLAGRQNFEETDDDRWAGPKTTEQRLNERIGELQAKLRESQARCAALRVEVQDHEMAARKARNAQFNADMDRENREALQQAELSLRRTKAGQAELSREAPSTKRGKSGLPDIDKFVDFAHHIMDRVDRVAERPSKREAAGASGDEPSATPRDDAAQSSTHAEPANEPSAGDGGG